MDKLATVLLYKCFPLYQFWTTESTPSFILLQTNCGSLVESEVTFFRILTAAFHAVPFSVSKQVRIGPRRGYKQEKITLLFKK